MADVLTGNPFVSKSAEPRDRDKTIQRVLLGLVIVLSIALVAELVYHLAIAPRLAISVIDIENGTVIPDQELLSIAGVHIGMMYFRVDVDELADRIQAVPAVRNATVDLVFPNRMKIRVTQRQPLACAVVDTDSGARTLVFDEEGVVFRIGHEPSAEMLPVVSGLRFPAAEIGLRLPDLLVGFLESLRTLRDEAPELYALFSEYRVVRKNESTFDVVLYPMHFSVPVRIGTRIDVGMVQYIVMMLDMLRREGRLENAAELDFRSGEGVLRAKGGDRG
ncbi:MAG: FtsQ-type POTRA domain-containing protein [Spirochaetales bacterium]|nr:FtsQ-type POTRA domain-containing protein [Spirochaetales bacterium]